MRFSFSVGVYVEKYFFFRNNDITLRVHFPARYFYASANNTPLI